MPLKGLNQSFLETHVLSEVSCNDGRHDSGNGPECVGDSQKESCIPAGETQVNIFQYTKEIQRNSSYQSMYYFLSLESDYI